MSSISSLPAEGARTEEINEDLAQLAISAEHQPVGYGKPMLGNLPQKINLKIFSFLNQCTSACLGVTCRKFWGIHVTNYPKTTLFACTWVWTSPNWPRWQKTIYLFHLLKKWMGQQLTEEDAWLHEETVRIIRELRENPDTWMNFEYPDPELVNDIAKIVLGGQDW